MARLRHCPSQLTELGHSLVEHGHITPLTRHVRSHPIEGVFFKLRKNREATAIFQKSVNAFIRQGQYYGDVTWLLDYAEVLVMPRAANQGRNLAEGLQTTKRALSHSRCHEECLERLRVAWKSAKGSEADAARRLIRRSENGRLTLAAPYAERLQTQIPTTKSRSEANATSS